MAWYDQWLKKNIQNGINELLKAEGVSAPTTASNISGDGLPDTAEDGHDASSQIGRKAIVEDPYFDLMGSQVNYKVKMTRISNKTLKEVSVRDWLVSAIIQCRVDTLLRFSRPQHQRFEMGFRVIKRDNTSHYTQEERDEIASIEDFIYNCGRKEGTPGDDKRLFGEFLKLIGRDALTFGHVAIEKVKTRAGGLHRFRPMPAESVYLINKSLSKDQVNSAAMNSYQLNKPKSDNDPKSEQVVNEVQNDYLKYVQVSYDNRPLATFGDEDMIFKLFNPQNFADSQGYCYVPGTAWVQFADGSVKLVEDVRVGDEVVTHTGEIKKVLELKNRDTSEEIYQISPYGLMDQHVSGEHPILIMSRKERRSWEHTSSKEKGTSPKLKWISAKDIREGDYVTIPKIEFSENFTSIDLAKYGDINKDGFIQANIKQNCPQVKLTRSLPVTDELAFILGLYLGDGCVVSSSLRFDLGFDEQYLADKIHSYFSTLGIKTSQKTSSCLQVFVNSKVMTSLFKDLCPGNTWTKQLSPVLFNMSKSSRLSLILGHIHADGTVSNTGDITATSTSISLLNGLATMYNSLGYLAKIKQYGKEGDVIKTLRNKQTVFHKSDSFRIQYPGGGFIKQGIASIKGKAPRKNTKTYHREDDNNFYVSISRIKSYTYTGKVNNFEVQDNHSYIANQVATHNCYSPLELAIINITNHLNVENYNANFFTHGYAARGVLHLKGTVTQQQLANFRRTFYNNITGHQHAWRTPIIAGLDDVQWVPMSASAREMEYINFNNHLMRILCSQFQIDPMELGLDYLISGSGRAPMQQANNEYKIVYSRERGLLPLLMFVEDIVNSEILPAIDKDLGGKYRFVFTGYTDETPQSEIAQMQAEMTVWKSMNDLLQQAQKNKMEESAGDLPLNQAFWALVEKNYTRGEIREKFFGDKDAAKRRELQYIPGDQMFLPWQQLMVTMDAQEEQKKQMAEQQEAMQQEAQVKTAHEEQKYNHQEAKHQRDKEKHELETESLKAQAANDAVQHGMSLKDTAKEFGASKASNVGGKVIANPINRTEE